MLAGKAGHGSQLCRGFTGAFGHRIRACPSFHPQEEDKVSCSGSSALALDPGDAKLVKIAQTFPRVK